MATELICPDCGGVINGPVNDNRPRCQCDSDLTMDDTEVEAQPALPAASVASAPVVTTPKPAKVCCVCGKDVTNARRAKDARGYWCYECHRADLRKERFGDKPRARCPQCGRMVPAESITTYHGNTMCTKCMVEQEELPNHLKLKYRVKLDDDGSAAKKEKVRLIAMASFLGVLFVIMVLRWVGVL